MKARNIFLIFSLFSSIVIFWLTYGLAILNPLYDDWILSMGFHDIVQHYIGWLFYRQSPWHFPIGLIDNLAYPYQFSIMYTDSIPLFAVPFKLFLAFLPETFQYFGIWALLCLFLTGFLSSLIVFKLTKNIYYSILCSIFFILMPAIYQRMFTHTSLAGHWILLFGIYLCICKNDFFRWKLRIFWCIAFGLAISIHAYFVPMLGLLLLGCTISKFLEDKKIFFAILDVALPLFTLFFVMWMLGAFDFVDSSAATGFGYYSANLNTFFYSKPIEIFSENLPYGVITSIFNIKVMSGQYEGYGYLGFGILVLGLITLFLFFKNIKNITIKKDHVLIFFVLFICFCYSLSNNVYLGETKILSIHLPPKIEQLCSTFRASGRFIWMVDYSLFVIIFYYIYKNFSEFTLGIVFLCLCLQCYDLREFFIRLKKDPNVQYENNLISKLPKHKNIIISDSPILTTVEEAFTYSKNNYELAYYAYKNSTAINDFNIARKNENKIKEYKTKIQNELDNGIVRDDSIYFFTTDLYKKFENVLNLERNDGYTLGYKK